MQLHHCAFKISLGHSHLVQNFCEFMGAKLVWEGHDQGREIAMQFENYFRIQFSEIAEKPVISKNKQEGHLAFLSDDPINDIGKIEKWFVKNNIKTRQGDWSDREQWLDCPNVFIDFVIEVFKAKK